MKKPDNRVVFGRGGSGKTNLVRTWINPPRGRVIVFDANGEDHYAAGGAFVLDDYPALMGLMLRRPAQVRVAWRGLGEITLPHRGKVTAFEAVNEVAWAAGNVTLVWEEVDQFFRSGASCPFAFRIINQGRHRNIRVIAISRRPATVTRDLTANASEIYAFGTTEPRDLDYFEKLMGRDAVAKINALPRYSALHWTENGATVKKIRKA